MSHQFNENTYILEACLLGSQVSLIAFTIMLNKKKNINLDKFFLALEEIGLTYVVGHNERMDHQRSQLGTDRSGCG